MGWQDHWLFLCWLWLALLLLEHFLPRGREAHLILLEEELVPALEVWDHRCGILNNRGPQFLGASLFV